MNPIIVADAGPLIALAKIDHLFLLRDLFSKIYIPEIVLFETTQKGPFSDALLIKEFAANSAQIHPDLDTPFSRQLRTLLDEGEVQALALAQQLDCGVLMDERRGRQIARRHDIAVVGVLGVLLQAKLSKRIGNLKPLVDALQGSGYRISTDLVAAVLKLAAEK